MNEPRIHYFSVAIAKMVFAHPKHGLVFVRDPIPLEAAKSYGLKPVILYNVAAAGTAIAFPFFTLENAPESFSAVLSRIWSAAEGLRGLPDQVWVSRHLADSCKALAESLNALGIELRVADGKDQRFSSSIRSAQGKIDYLAYDRDNVAKIDSVAQLNLQAESIHRRNLQYQLWGAYRPSQYEATKAFLALPLRTSSAEMPDSGEWDKGSWLASWDANVPPTSQCHFHQSETATWLIKDEYYESDSESEDDSDEDGADADDGLEIVKLLLDAWPLSYAGIAQIIGTSVRALQWHVTRKASIDPTRAYLLRTILGVEIDSYGYYSASGNCCLLPESVRAASLVYNELSHGGDLEFSFEAVPDQGKVDPSWRYMVFRACGDRLAVMMIARGSKVDAKFNEDTFINFSGIRDVSAHLYEDIKSACAKACLDPLRNRQIIHELECKHTQYWESQDGFSMHYR